MQNIKTLLLSSLLFLGLSSSVIAGHHGEAKKDIVDTAVAAGDFSTLVTAVKAADLVDTLKGEGPFTVFAPNDAALRLFSRSRTVVLRLAKMIAVETSSLRNAFLRADCLVRELVLIRR